jgi:hypothetical protein
MERRWLPTATSVTNTSQGRDAARYWPLSHVEQFVTALFAACYSAGLTAVLVT